MPVIPALGKQRQGISKFEARLIYRVNSRTAMDIQRNPVSKNQKKNGFRVFKRVKNEEMKNTKCKVQN